MDVAERIQLIEALEELCFLRSVGFRDTVHSLAFGLDQIARIRDANARDRALAEMKENLNGAVKVTSAACDLGLEDSEVPIFTRAMFARAASIAAAFPAKETRV